MLNSVRLLLLPLLMKISRRTATEKSKVRPRRGGIPFAYLYVRAVPEHVMLGLYAFRNLKPPHRDCTFLYDRERFLNMLGFSSCMLSEIRTVGYGYDVLAKLDELENGLDKNDDILYSVLLYPLLPRIKENFSISCNLSQPSFSLS